MTPRAGGVLLAVCLAATLLGCQGASFAVAPPETQAPEAQPSLSPTRAPVTPIATTTPAPQSSAPPSRTPAPAPTLAPQPTPLPPLVVLDAGHGGRDVGARHFTGNHADLYESNVSLALALRTRDLMQARGLRVFLTRDGDYRVANEQDVNADGEANALDEVQARVDLITRQDADLLLSIHQNAYEGAPGEDVSDVGGTVVYYCADRPFSDRNLALAESVHAYILTAYADLGYPIRDRGVLDDLEAQEPGKPGTHLVLLGPQTGRIVRAAELPGALSETGFITDDAEARLLADPQALDRFALAYADAISAYLAEWGQLER